MLFSKTGYTVALAFVLALACLLSNPVKAAESENLVCTEVDIFVREGCPYCQQAKSFLAELQQGYPELIVNELDIEQQPASLDVFRQLIRERHIRQPGVPTFSFCDEVLVGFSSVEVSGTLIEQVLTGQRESLVEGMAAQVPVFGELSPSSLGLPVFTIAIGLVDGFNPCAMWVLLFLLSMLVHVEKRSRIIMIAGTFVIISGVIYYAFMAAWFNVFLILGFSRGLQLALGVFALLIGAVHVKDFFMLGRGISLSIPEGVKPTIYERTRRIVRAENVFASMFGVAIIAILVNFVELLCTAGLPALYTQILTYYPLSTADYYGYLLLYILAYMADDALMVTIAVVTLSHHKLQEKQGRWLKLISGGVICILGALLIFAPDLMVF